MDERCVQYLPKMMNPATTIQLSHMTGTTSGHTIVPILAEPILIARRMHTPSSSSMTHVRCRILHHDSLQRDNPHSEILSLLLIFFPWRLSLLSLFSYSPSPSLSSHSDLLMQSRSLRQGRVDRTLGDPSVPISRISSIIHVLHDKRYPPIVQELPHMVARTVASYEDDRTGHRSILV